MELLVEATTRRLTAPRSGRLWVRRAAGPNWLVGQPDDASDDGYHRECGADQSHVGGSVADKRWNDLSPRTRRLVLIGAAIVLINSVGAVPLTYSRPAGREPRGSSSQR
jgi:hypothetical protein